MARHHRLHTRALAAACAALIGLACGGSEQSPTAPDASLTPPPPAPPPPAPPASNTSLTGTVTEFSDSGVRRPVPNLRLKVRAGSSGDGAVGGADLPDVVTDAFGRYEITNITKGLLFVATAPGSTHKFLCDYYGMSVTLVRMAPFLADLPVVPATWSGDRLPPGMLSSGTSVHGVVSELVEDVRRPVVDATVTLDSGTQDPPARTNASGFYMVCSQVGTDQYRTITAHKDGYRKSIRTFFGGSESRIDLDIERR